MNKAKRILTISEAQIKELSPADLNELEEDLDEILEMIDGVEDSLDTEMSGYTLARDHLRKAIELIGGIKYTLGLMGSGRA